MKEASKVMYTIARIFALVGIIVYSVLALVGLILVIANNGDNGLLATGVSLLSVGLVFTAIYVVTFILGGRAVESINDGSREIKYHIICMVVGAISYDVFYLLGGIFGLVSRNRY